MLDLRYGVRVRMTGSARPLQRRRGRSHRRRGHAIAHGDALIEEHACAGSVRCGHLASSLVLTSKRDVFSMNATRPLERRSPSPEAVVAWGARTTVGVSRVHDPAQSSSPSSAVARRRQTRPADPLALDCALARDIQWRVSRARTYLKIWRTRCVTGQTICGYSAVTLWHGGACFARTDRPLNERTDRNTHRRLQPDTPGERHAQGRQAYE